MSNLARINTNKVENVKTGQVYFELDIYDNYNYGSINITKEQTSMTDLESLQYLKDMGSDESANICDLIDSLLEYQNGLFINGTWYSWDEIKHFFEG